MKILSWRTECSIYYQMSIPAAHFFARMDDLKRRRDDCKVFLRKRRPSRSTNVNKIIHVIISKHEFLTRWTLTHSLHDFKNLHVPISPFTPPSSLCWTPPLSHHLSIWAHSIFPFYLRVLYWWTCPLHRPHDAFEGKHYRAVSQTPQIETSDTATQISDPVDGDAVSDLRYWLPESPYQCRLIPRHSVGYKFALESADEVAQLNGQLPTKARNTVPINLLTVLEKTKSRALQPSLTQDYILVSALVSHVLSFHRSGWLHGIISVFNIVWINVFYSFLCSPSIACNAALSHSFRQVVSGILETWRVLEEENA